MDYKVTESGVSRTDIPIHRITWSDGRWWEVLGMMPSGVATSMRVAMSRVAKARAIGDAVHSEPDTALDAEAWATAAAKARMERLKGCTVAWAWSDPVSESMLDDMPPFRVQDVRSVLDDLHAEDLEVTGADEKKSSPSPSSIESPSGANGSLPSNI